MLRKKQSPKDRALISFDDFYGSVFGNRWKSIRLALLCQHKYIALVNNFGDTDETIQALESEGAIDIRKIYQVTKGKLETDLGQTVFSQDNVYKLDSKIDRVMSKQKTEEMSRIFPENSSQMDTFGSSDHPESERFDGQRVIDSAYGTAGLYEYVPATKLKGMEDWVFESDHYKYYKANDADFPVDIKLDTELEIPEHLNMFTFEMGNVSRFPRANKCVTGVYSHFLMDGASILPAIFLGIKPGDRVLDACAAPGGKSLLLLQTLYPNILVSNDIAQSRVNRVKKIFKEFVCDFDSKWLNKRCFITDQDARGIEEYNQYDRILVDVPCTTDRHTLTENENNMFKPSRVKERLRIPELQAAILTNCLRLLKPGGSLVYSTCSLSPIQNDGVVHMALSKCFSEHGITARVK